MKANSEIVELNVGGSIYTTSRTTLASNSESMLARMTAPDSLPTATDSNNRIFIDRDGPLFRYIVNFLRDKRLSLPENFTEHAQLYSEADFYQIEPIKQQLEKFFPNKLDANNSLLAKDASLKNSSLKSIGFYFTIVSKLYKGTIMSIIGCIRILNRLSCLNANSRRFIAYIMKTEPNIDKFICEIKFMHDEQILIIKPCGLRNSSSNNIRTKLSQNIFQLAKKYEITTGYWDEMFYLPMGNMVPTRELMCSFLRQNYNAKLLTSTLSDKSSNSGDYHESRMLVERWTVSSFDVDVV